MSLSASHVFCALQTFVNDWLFGRGNHLLTGQAFRKEWLSASVPCCKQKDARRGSDAKIFEPFAIRRWKGFIYYVQENETDSVWLNEDVRSLVLLCSEND